MQHRNDVWDAAYTQMQRKYSAAASHPLHNDAMTEIDLDDRVVTLTEPSPDTQVAYDPLPGQPY